MTEQSLYCCPFSAGVKVSDQGAGEGIVQSFTMVLTAPGIDLEANTLLSNTDWYFRLQSTDGGDSSAKTGGYISSFPPCEYKALRCKANASTTFC